MYKDGMDWAPEDFTPIFTFTEVCFINILSLLNWHFYKIM